MTSFLIIDDHPLFREALGNAIRLAHPTALIFEAMSIQGAIHILSSGQEIDLALLDLTLPDAVGFSGFLRLREAYPRLPVAIVSSHDEEHVIVEALSLGAAGYLPKSTSKREIAQSIDRVLSGLTSVPDKFQFAGGLSKPDSQQALRAGLQELTPQQLRVLELIRRGFQNKQIAGELRLAESTVKAHVTEILRKLNLFSRNKAVVEISKLGLTNLESLAASRADRSRPK
ncbi:MAG: response regulator transcription factor [Xanthobacteraceae bacterium]|nr:response regulator transcription factor [Xanthobacteraceae bacterium]